MLKDIWVPIDLKSLLSFLLPTLYHRLYTDALDIGIREPYLTRTLQHIMPNLFYCFLCRYLQITTVSIVIRPFGIPQ